MAQQAYRRPARMGYLLPLALVATACSQGQQADTSADPTNIEISNTAPADPALAANLASPAAAAPVADVGNGKWEAGMQMGQFWAAVTNAKEDAFRFIGDEKGGNAVNWRPSFELKDKAALGTTAGTAKLSVGERTLDMPFTLEDGSASATGNSDDVRQLLLNANGQPLCLTVSTTGYQTCFSTAGAKDALE